MESRNFFERGGFEREREYVPKTGQGRFNGLL